MDVKQRYIGESKYGLDQRFIDALTDVPIIVSMGVAKFIDECHDQISTTDKDYTTYGGVVHVKEEAVFFSVEIFNDVKDMPYLLDFKLISADEYLDFILIKNYLKK